MVVAEATVGVLALQGDFERHQHALEQAGAQAVQVRTPADLEKVDALIIPGGESTTMLRVMEEENLIEPLRNFGQCKPIFGTCAGAILLASEVLHPPQPSLGLMDMTVERNAYGRQIDSRIASIDLDGDQAEAVFIRAPIIRRTGPEARVLAKYLDTPVLVEAGKHMVATFHPELSKDNRVHKRFLQKVAENKDARASNGQEADG